VSTTSPLQDDTDRATTSRAYVYGVVRRSDANERRREGIAETDVVFVHHEDLSALVSHVAGRGEIRARRRDLLRHSDVLQDVLADGPVLPLRFGTVLADAASVVDELLAPRREELRALLTELDGVVELSVRAFYREEAVLAEIVAEDKRVASLRERTKAGGAAHALHVELGEAVARALDRKRAHDADAILAATRKLARDVVIQDRQSELEILRASFLVERSQVDSFDRVMNELAGRRSGTVLFKYVGPLPPHSFVSLRLGGR
jgi:gas vesicle protein GvpL/GvpF